MKIQQLSPDEIVYSTQYCYHFELELPDLERSIKSAGVLRPVWVVAREKPLLIDGHRRLHISQKLKIETIPVQVFAGDELAKTYILGLQLNLARGDLSMMEKLRAFHIAKRNFSSGTVGEVTNLLEFSHLPRLAEIEKKLFALPDWVHGYFHQADIGLRMMQRLLDYPFPEYEPWFRAGFQLNIKGTELSGLLDQIRDISLRDEVSADALWKMLNSSGFLKESLSPQQKVGAIKKWMAEKRNPVLTQIRKAVQETAGKVEKTMPGNCHVGWDPSLEDPAISLNFRFKTFDELQEIINKIQDEKMQQELSRLLDKMNQLP